MTSYARDVQTILKRGSPVETIMNVSSFMALLFAPALMMACSSGGSSLTEQDSAAAAAAFGAVIDSCSARVTADGSIDQVTLGGSGWTRIERTNKAGIEVTLWQHKELVGRLELVDYDGELADSCMFDARAAGSDGADKVLVALTRKLGAPKRHGTVPQGGDFLTPRKLEKKVGYYWPLSRSDVYLTVFDDQTVRIEILAMPDRQGLDRYSSDRPESRIITED
jgi:hypothetical protein